MDYAESIVQLLANLIVLLLCLFRYIGNKRRGWLYAIIFFLCSLLSSYFWTAYLLVTGTDPNVADVFTYTGWDLAFPVLFVLLMHMKSTEERKYFHPLMLLPVPLNILQLFLYLPYGHLLNNIWQVGLVTLIACFSLQGLLRYWFRRKEGASVPWVSLSVFLFTLFEFGMWTASCLEEPFGSLYYLFSFLCSLDYLFIGWSVGRAYSRDRRQRYTTFDAGYRNVLRAASLGIVLAFSLGGILLAAWMRDVMSRYLGDSSAGVYDVIPVVLFVISLILVVFVIAILFVVYYAQRAAEISELREARRIAERSNAAKSEFLANMSHEIRTPISTVMGMNEIILRESRQARDSLPEDREAARGVFSDICGYSEAIDGAGRNLLAIISDILDLSRIEAGKLEIRPGRYTLGSVLSDVCGTAAFRARARNLDFRVSVDAQLPDQLYGDSLRVRQIILNILNNAVKYTRQGSVTLSVAGAEAGPYECGKPVNLVFTVSDTGVGIRQEDLSKLFDKFERADLAENVNVEGTGLGLAISKSLLDMMGGTVRVESEYGKGSVFTVTVPQIVMSAEPVGEFRGKQEKTAGEARVSGPLFRAPDARVLIVDDTRMNLIVAEGLLKGTEMKVDTAAAGADAVAMALRVPYDVILMDQRMPGMNGTEAMRLIREQEGGANRHTPFICLTADAISGARERYLAEGFTDYLSKPIDSAAMKAMMIRCLLPEKVQILSGNGSGNAPAAAEPAPAPRDAVGTLRADGIDPVRGLRLCRNDEALYSALLREFGRDADEKLRRLRDAYAASSWKDYALLAHSLRSASAAVGAARLSELAAALETAADREDTEALRRDHPVMLDLYRRASDAARSCCDGPFAPEE